MSLTDSGLTVAWTASSEHFSSPQSPLHSLLFPFILGRWPHIFVPAVPHDAHILVPEVPHGLRLTDGAQLMWRTEFSVQTSQVVLHVTSSLALPSLSPEFCVLRRPVGETNVF